MENIYEVQFGNSIYKCHYDEIIHWQITKYANQTIYAPMLKTGKLLYGKCDEEGLNNMNKYFKYKNYANKRSI